MCFPVGRRGSVAHRQITGGETFERVGGKGYIRGNDSSGGHSELDLRDNQTVRHISWCGQECQVIKDIVLISYCVVCFFIDLGIATLVTASITNSRGRRNIASDGVSD